MIVKIAWIAVLSIGFAVAAEEKVDFQRDVRPILSDKVLLPAMALIQRLVRRICDWIQPEGAYEDLGGYSAVVPGKVNESELYLRITSTKKKRLCLLRSLTRS
jgi:hypothetical protein